jgi:hypothetical protein
MDAPVEYALITGVLPYSVRYLHLSPAGPSGKKPTISKIGRLGMTLLEQAKPWPMGAYL